MLTAAHNNNNNYNDNNSDEQDFVKFNNGQFFKYWRAI